MSETMNRDECAWIVVRCSSGDEAECPTPASALTAALCLTQEAWEQRKVQGHDPTVTFFVNGVAVRTCDRKALLTQTAALRRG